MLTTSARRPADVPCRRFSFALAFFMVAGASASVAVAQATDLTEVEIHVGVDRTNGVLDPLPYDFTIEVEGENFTLISVQTPNGGNHFLTQGSEAWRFHRGDFVDLCAIESSPDIGFGDFVFTFVGPASTDGVVVPYDPRSPTCTTDPHSGYADVTAPAHLATNVGLHPTFTWQCANGPCGNFAWYIEVYPTAGVGAEFEANLLDTGAATWTPEGCLTGNTQYMFYIAAGSILPPGIQTLSTATLMDDFFYVKGFETLNQTSFTTQATISTNYCMTAPNSAGAGAVICASGSETVADQHLDLIASGCPDNAPGLFYFGPNQLNGAPFGDGFRCVGVPQSKRMYPFAVSGPANGNPAGTATLAADFATPYATSITPGASLNFQFWYRDGMAMMSGFNLTDALNVVFQ